MTKEEIYKEVEKDLLTHFDAKVLIPMYERLAVIIMESTIKAINYTHCCRELCDEERCSYTLNNNSKMCDDCGKVFDQHNYLQRMVIWLDF